MPRAVIMSTLSFGIGESVCQVFKKIFMKVLNNFSLSSNA